LTGPTLLEMDELRLPDLTIDFLLFKAVSELPIWTAA